MRVLLVTIGIVVVVFLGLILLDRADLLTEGSAAGTSSMAPTLPPCNGRTIAQGFT